MFKLLGFLSAALLVATLFGGYFVMRNRQVRQVVPDSHQQTSNAKMEAIKFRVFEDEAYLKKSQAVIGGTVENVSDQPLTQLAVTIKLHSKGGQHDELKIVALEPSTLEAGARAAYQLMVPTDKWKGAKVVGVINASTQSQYAFQSSRGNLRPSEQIVPRQARTIIVERPAPRKKGEEFLNTPDNPVIIK